MRRGQGGGEGGFRFGSPRASEATLPFPGGFWVLHLSIPDPAGARASFFSQDLGLALTCALHFLWSRLFVEGYSGVSSPPSSSHPAFQFIPLREEGART